MYIYIYIYSKKAEYSTSITKKNMIDIKHDTPHECLY
jgi:hypothetical protein